MAKIHSPSFTIVGIDAPRRGVWVEFNGQRIWLDAPLYPAGGTWVITEEECLAALAKAGQER